MSDFVTPDVRNGIPLPSRPFKSPMTLPVRACSDAVASDASRLAAGADEAEADTPDGVATRTAVIDAQLDRLYRDDVEHVRQSRLSRWQEQR